MIPIILVSAFIFSFLTMFLLHKFVRIKSLMDFPNDRKIHKKIVPLYGGLVFVGLFLIYCVLFVRDSLFMSSYMFFIGGVLVFFLGICDDVFKLNWKYKLGSQLFILFFCVGFIDTFSFFGIEFSSIMASIVFSFWFLGIVNAVNLLDGLDGLAAGVSLLFLMAFLFLINKNVLMYDYSFIYLLLFFCLTPFLFFNFHPAKLYMGSAGSLFLGYFFAILPLLFSLDTSFVTDLAYDFTFFIWIYAYIIFDTIRVLVLRLVQKKNPFLPDKTHLHHILTKRFGVIKAVLLIFCINISFILTYFILN